MSPVTHKGDLEPHEGAGPPSFAYPWICMLGTPLSSEHHVPGSDPFFGKRIEGTVPVLGMSSFSGEEQKADGWRS